MGNVAEIAVDAVAVFVGSLLDPVIWLVMLPAAVFGKRVVWVVVAAAVFAGLAEALVYLTEQGTGLPYKNLLVQRFVVALVLGLLIVLVRRAFPKRPAASSDE